MEEPASPVLRTQHGQHLLKKKYLEGVEGGEGPTKQTDHVKHNSKVKVPPSSKMCMRGADGTDTTDATAHLQAIVPHSMM